MAMDEASKRRHALIYAYASSAEIHRLTTGKRCRFRVAVGRRRKFRPARAEGLVPTGEENGIL